MAAAAPSALMDQRALARMRTYTLSLEKSLRGGNRLSISFAEIGLITQISPFSTLLILKSITALWSLGPMYFAPSGCSNDSSTRLPSSAWMKAGVSAFAFQPLFSTAFLLKNTLSQTDQWCE